MRTGLPFFFVLLQLTGYAQFSEGFRELSELSKKKEILPSDSSVFFGNIYKNGLHYLYPFYKAFYREQQLLQKDTGFYYDNLSQALSFAGDYPSVLELERQRMQKPSDISYAVLDTLTHIVSEYADARKYILSHTKTRRVVMINEAHNKPLHRAFVLSLLEDLYQQGFRYLALEMLYNDSHTTPTKINAALGYYTSEPLAGELVRIALELGYTLVPYEDNLSHHTPRQREYAQAQNLTDFISKKDTTAKMLVLAGYGHIAEASLQDDQIPMAAYFRILSGIDPLTIDQTQLTEYGTSSYTAVVYDAWIKKHPVGNPSVILAGQQAFDLFGLHLYDISMIHPPTRFSNGRPVWMAVNGLKKETPVTPAYRTTFLVQAYYASEYNEKKPEQSIPADQTYVNSVNGLYHLYLRKGKYKLVFRDKLYAILGSRELVTE